MTDRRGGGGGVVGDRRGRRRGSGFAPARPRQGLHRRRAVERAIVELQLRRRIRRSPIATRRSIWLAHSEHETGDQAAAIQTIARLEREFPASRWVRPARSLRVQIAQSMRRDDLLWRMAVPPAPPRRPAPRMTPLPPRLRAPNPLAAPRYARRSRRVDAFADAPRRASSRPPAPPVAPAPPAPSLTAAAPWLRAAGAPGHRTARARRAAEFWVRSAFPADTDLRIEALGGLMDSSRRSRDPAA